MKSRIVLICLWMFAFTAFAQSDRGTITGTVIDPAGAVVADASVVSRNVDTGAIYQVATSATGNYTLPQLPIGSYELTVAVPGFKTYIRQGLTVAVAQTYRVDVALEVGVATESVTVTDAAPLLKTDSGELSHIVQTSSLNNLPVLGTGASAGSSGIRNPYAALQVLPGTYFSGDNISGIRVNGSPSNTQALRIDGQDATNGWYWVQSQTQPSVDAIQEFAIQTSNYAAEFGQAGGGLFNATMRSGTNQFHGSAYDYFVNEALNAGVPFTDDGNGHLLRPRQRRNDYGFTVGGPVVIPNLYDGHDRTFFFFSFEQFRETTVTNNVSSTLPTLPYRAGDFSSALTGRNLGTDGLGRTLAENVIYDPLTDRVEADGLRYRDPFPGNIIPLTQQDSVARKVQTFMPDPTSSGKVNNYQPTFRTPLTTTIPSVKIDYQLSDNGKLSGFWSVNKRNDTNTNALPFPITNAVPQTSLSHTARLNYDHTLTPTLLAHVGIGLIDTHIDQALPEFDPEAELGLRGANSNNFPNLRSLSDGQGGLSGNTGAGTLYNLVIYKPTANTFVTWVKGDHTFKFGGEFMANGYKMFNVTYSMGWYNFNSQQSGLPALNGVSLPTDVGFPYASFLLGRVDSGTLSVPALTRMGAHSISGYAQDTWKVTRTLTIDYGLRYDFSTYLQDGNGYYGVFSPDTPNPGIDNRLGAVIYEGFNPGTDRNGFGRCNCWLAKNYPWAFGPRLGVAYQINPKTVLRIGAGLSYYKTDQNNVGFSAGSQFLYNSPGYADAAFNLQNGVPFDIFFPNFDPAQQPLPGTVASPPQLMDQNAGRPARQYQWSVGIQREIASNLLVEAAYVGNRGVWWNAANLISPNSNQPGVLQSAWGINMNNPADLTLLRSQMNSSIAAARGFSGLPYSSFPDTATVAQALRPYPQFSNLSNWHWVPIGNTWYDSLQTKLTQRLSHGLDFSAAFTWQKQITSGVENDFGRGFGVIINDAFNRRNQKTLSVWDQPFQFVFAGNYTTPSWGNRRILSWATRDWTLGAVLRYGSGFPIATPNATTGLATYTFQNTLLNRVPGEPLFLQDLNGSYDPRTTFVLNPAAWANPPAGQWGTATAYYGDFRSQRRPDESLSIARNFRFKESYNLQIRAEFSNVFNRTQVNNPDASNAFATQTKNSAGITTAGFGRINTGTVFAPPRQGTIVARFTF